MKQLTVQLENDISLEEVMDALSSKDKFAWVVEYRSYDGGSVIGSLVREATKAPSENPPECSGGNCSGLVGESSQDLSYERARLWLDIYRESYIKYGSNNNMTAEADAKSAVDAFDRVFK